jgi:hypothetical protein
MSDNATEKFHSLAQKALTASSLGAGAPPEAEEAAETCRESVTALLAVGTAAEANIAHWDSVQAEALVPREGAELKRQEARQKAQELASSATRHFERAYEEAEEALLQSSAPKVATDREILARQEFSLGIGDARGAEAKSRLLGLARGGSDEARAVINTSFGRQKLISQGVRDVDGTLKMVRKVMAAENTAVKEQLERLDNLQAAAAAAQAAVRHGLGQ